MTRSGLISWRLVAVGRISACIFVLLACAFVTEDVSHAQIIGRQQSTQSVAEGTDVARRRDEALTADLQEAIDLLKAKKHTLLVYDFLPGLAMIAQDDPRRGGPGNASSLLTIPPEVADMLLGQLTAALAGDRTFNRNHTLVQIDCVLKPSEIVPPKPPANLPALESAPKVDSEGLGGDLKKALASATRLLQADETEQFIRAMYPLPKLGRLTNSDELRKLLGRLKANPAMKEAMLRDLQFAARSEIDVKESVAEVTLPPLVQGDPERTVKFEKVQGNWRFFDSDAPTRSLHAELMKSPVAGFTIPGVETVLVLKWFEDEECWRLLRMPATGPLQ